MTSKSSLSCKAVSHDSDSKVKGLRVHRVKLIGTLAKPQGIKGTQHICYDVDIQELESEGRKEATCGIQGWERKGRDAWFSGVKLFMSVGNNQWNISERCYQIHWNLSSVNCVWRNIIICNSYSTLHSYTVSADDKQRTGLCANNNECSTLSYHQGKPGCWMSCLMKWWSCSITPSAYEITVTIHLYSLDDPLLGKYIAIL